MSIKINLIEILEQKIDSFVSIEISIDECLRILLQNFKENIEAGAPLPLIEKILMKTYKTVNSMKEIYAENVLKLK